MSSKGPRSVLVVEDEADLRRLVVERLEGKGFVVDQAINGSDALARLAGSAYDGLVVDLRLPDGNGMDVLRAALDRDPQIRSIVITGFGGVEDAVQALKLGAVDFLVKPFLLAQLEQILLVAINERRLEAENAELRAELRDRFHFDRIVGTSEAMRRLFATLDLVAPAPANVLVHGETGTGKTLVARTIHYNSPRRDERFVTFNAAAIPDTLADAELFGQAKGASGAAQTRAGRFELADKGTLFIDEVGVLSMALQTKLLRALQTREIERDAQPRAVDVRCIAATSIDLNEAVRVGTFREDLFSRLNAVPIVLPPLRVRRDDIALLAAHFVRLSTGQHGVVARTLSPSALRMLIAHDWPGNVRELENAIEYAVAMSGRETEIIPAMLPAEVRHDFRVPSASRTELPEEGIDLNTLVDELERDLITRSLERTGGNKRQAARLLHLSRTTFIDKLNRLNPRQSPPAATT